MMTAKDIDTLAADWAARIDRGPLTADEECALEQWIEADSRHRGAFMRMRAIAVHTERARALGPGFDPRRRLAWTAGKMKWYAAAAACAAIAITTVIALPWVRGAQQYETRQGETRVVPLPDGTVMTLNTASNVGVEYSDHLRRIRLVEGEVFFDVAKEAARPFVVEVGGASVRAIGTSFSVRHLQDKPLQVIVREGVVELAQPSLSAPVRMTANMQAELPVRSAIAQIQPSLIDADEVGRRLAWRDGRIIFEHQTLAEAAAAFARYSQTPIVIDDPAVASLQITGLFAANDPISFAHTAAKTLGLKSQVRAGAVHLTQ